MPAILIKIEILIKIVLKNVNYSETPYTCYGLV